MGTMILAASTPPRQERQPGVHVHHPRRAGRPRSTCSIMRPQRNRQRKATQTQSQVMPGQRVRTTAGMYGTVISGDDRDVVIEIAPGVEVTMLRRAIMDVVSDDAMPSHEDIVTDEAQDARAGAPRPRLRPTRTPRLRTTGTSRRPQHLAAPRDLAAPRADRTKDRHRWHPLAIGRPGQAVPRPGRAAASRQSGPTSRPWRHLAVLAVAADRRCWRRLSAAPPCTREAGTSKFKVGLGLDLSSGTTVTHQDGGPRPGQPDADQFGHGPVDRDPEQPAERPGLHRRQGPAAGHRQDRRLRPAPQRAGHRPAAGLGACCASARCCWSRRDARLRSRRRRRRARRQPSSSPSPSASPSAGPRRGAKASALAQPSPRQPSAGTGQAAGARH